MISIIAVILVLGGLIFFHELGHFFAARSLGVGVREFSIGFGKKIFGWKRGKTTYQLALVPLGGYVQLAGESNDGASKDCAVDNEADAEFEQSELFSLRPAWQKMIVVASGPIANFILALILTWIVVAFFGVSELSSQIGKVQADSPAAKAGLMANDTITAIDGEKVRYFSEIPTLIQKSTQKELLFSITRNNEELSIPISPAVLQTKNIFGETVTIKGIGIQLNPNSQITIDVPFFASFPLAVEQTWLQGKLIITSIGKLLSGVVSPTELGGPITIAKEVGKSTKAGIQSVLMLAAFISLNLGLLNLLPVPVLDGGHIVFYGIEMITGRPINEKLYNILTKIGLFLLLALMALALYNDVFRLVTS